MPVLKRIIALLAAAVLSVLIVQRGIKFFYDRYAK